MKRIAAQWHLTNRYLRQRLLWPGLIAFVLFLGAAVGGYFLFASNTAAAEQFLSALRDTFASKGLYDAGALLPLLLLGNNLLAAAQCIVSGGIPFLFLPGWNLLLNGGIIGVVLTSGQVFGGASPIRLFVTGILPHGIFEIPALILAGAVGLRLCHILCRQILGRSAQTNPLDELKRIPGVFCFYVIPLLILAAVVESYLTPLFLG